MNNDLGGITMDPIEKLTKEQIMEHKTRKEIMKAIYKRPGITYTEIRNEVGGIPQGSISWHLKVMMEKKMIKFIMAGVNKKFYTWEFKGKGLNSLTPKEEIIMEIIKTNNNPTQKEIVTKSGFTQPTVSRITRKMRSKKLIKVVWNDNPILGHSYSLM